MKTTKTLLPILTGFLFAAAANAQVDITLTGSTAFRSIAFDRVAALYDSGVVTRGDMGNGPGTYYGTMSNAIPSLGAAPVAVRLSFSGSGSGMLAVKNGTPLATIDPITGNSSNKAPDLAFSDVFPESASPPIAGSSFDQSIVGVIPFVWIRNNAMSSINNMTREQGVLLMTASGTIGGLPGMPQSYLGGGSSDPIYLTGRDSGSGTRITAQKVLGFTGTPTLWGISATDGSLVQTNGYSSGGSMRAVIQAKTNVIGYLGLADAAAISASASPIAYEGVTCSPAAVQSGQYPFWGYEHLVNNKNALSANQAAIRNKLITYITNQGYQTTNSLYTNNFVDQANMQVERGADGATITSLNF